MKRVVAYILSLMLIILLVGCGSEEQQRETGEAVTSEDSSSKDKAIEDNTENHTEDNSMEPLQAPTKDEVLAMREKVLDGMTQEEIDRLTENIKVANLQMESAYLTDHIFQKLSDKDSVYWQYFDKKGDIQLGWWYKGSICSMDMIMKAEGITEEEFYNTYDEPGIVYNKLDAQSFIDLIGDMMNAVHDEKLLAALQQLIDMTSLAVENHDVQYAQEIYKLLHDLDYFLLRYGIEDVGKYTQDLGTVSKYYGVLNMYD